MTLASRAFLYFPLQLSSGVMRHGFRMTSSRRECVAHLLRICRRHASVRWVRSLDAQAVAHGRLR